MRSTAKHPNQPLVRDKHRTVRFKKNHIVDYLLNTCRSHELTDMNRITLMGFSREDRRQFAQLIGYSLAGFAELPYVTRNNVKDVQTKPDTAERPGSPTTPSSATRRP